MKKLSAKRTQRASLRATKNLVEELGGRLVPGSGSGLEKGDGRVDGRFRIETKRPPTRKYRLTYKEWMKVRDAALRANEVPIFHIMLGAVELIVLREADYEGFGGTEEGYDLSNGSTSFLFTEQSLAAVPYGGHLNVWIGDGKTFFELRAMYRSDFIKLAEAQ